MLYAHHIITSVEENIYLPNIIQIIRNNEMNIQAKTNKSVGSV